MLCRGIVTTVGQKFTGCVSGNGLARSSRKLSRRGSAPMGVALEQESEDVRTETYVT